MPFRSRIAALAAASAATLAALLPLAAPAETLRSEIGISAVVVSAMAARYDAARPAGQRLTLSGENGAGLDLRTVGLYVGDERYADPAAAERAIEIAARGAKAPVVVSLVF